MPKVELEELMKPGEVAKKLRIGLSTVYHLAHRGEIPALKVGRTLRFSAAAIAKYLHEQQERTYVSKVA